MTSLHQQWDLIQWCGDVVLPLPRIDFVVEIIVVQFVIREVDFY